MQQSVVQPINSQRGMGAMGRRGDNEFWTRRPMAFRRSCKANKRMCHRLERRVQQKQEIRFWEEDERLAFEADMKELNDYFSGEMEADDEDYSFLYGNVGGSDDAHFARERMKAQLEDEFNYHTEPYYSGCPICGPLGCILD